MSIQWLTWTLLMQETYNNGLFKMQSSFRKKCYYGSQREKAKKINATSFFEAFEASLNALDVIIGTNGTSLFLVLIT